ncbi:MAG: DUF2510 domain-containing protein, partial [Actinomycetes bacterium]
MSDRSDRGTGQPFSAGPSPSGWYPDPAASGGLRYWSGTSWTSHVHPPHSSTSPATAGAARSDERHVARLPDRIGAFLLDVWAGLAAFTTMGFFLLLFSFLVGSCVSTTGTLLPDRSDGSKTGWFSSGGEGAWPVVVWFVCAFYAGVVLLGIYVISKRFGAGRLLRSGATIGMSAALLRLESAVSSSPATRRQVLLRGVIAYGAGTMLAVPVAWSLWGLVGPEQLPERAGVIADLSMQGAVRLL